MDHLVAAIRRLRHRRLNHTPVIAQDDDILTVRRGGDASGIAVGDVVIVVRIRGIVADGIQLDMRGGVVIDQLAVAGTAVELVLPLLAVFHRNVISSRRVLWFQLHRTGRGRVGQAQLAGRILDLAGTLPFFCAILRPMVVHVDILVAALLVLRQHPEIAQDDDLGFALGYADLFGCGQRVVLLIINRRAAAAVDRFFATLVPGIKSPGTFLAASRLVVNHVTKGVVIGHVVILIRLSAHSEFRLLDDVDGAVGLARIGAAAHGGDGAAPLVFVPVSYLPVVLVDVAVAHISFREHIGEGDGGGGAGGDLGVDLAAVAARQFKDLGHVVRGRDPVAPLREGDALIGAVGVFAVLYSAVLSRCKGHDLGGIR